MNNLTSINKKYQHQISHNQQQRNHYRSNERTYHSPNVYNNINSIKNIKNQSQNNIRAKKISNNNNIRYINQKNSYNQILNYAPNTTIMKQMKPKQQNQIYLEGELNNFMNNQQYIYPGSNINKSKNKSGNNIFQNNNNTYGQRISNGERTKNNRGLPKKSPIPVQKGFTTGKYLNNSNMSTISKYSNNTHNASYHTADSQLLNNMSQISGYSNYSYNQFNYGPFLENDRIRPYSNNTRTILSKNKKINDNILYNRNNNSNNKNIRKNNKSYNNLINKQNNNNSPYSYKVKTNNYINDNINYNNIMNSTGPAKTKYISKSPNPKGEFYSNALLNAKKNNNYINQNPIPNQNDYNMINNNSFSNISSMSNASSSMTHASYFTKMAQNNNSNIYNPNLKLYQNQNDMNLIMQNIRPMTSHSYKSRINNTNMKKKSNIKGNMIQSNNLNNPIFNLNPNEINYQNYNSNETKQKARIKMMLNNHNKIPNFNNNYINGYNTHTSKRQRSANLPARRNNNYNNNINPMVNLHIINRGQIINNNYNNINNLNNNANNINNNMNNLYVYKYDASQNNIRQRKDQNHKMNMSKRRKNIIRNINPNYDDEMNMIINYKNINNMNNIIPMNNNMNSLMNELRNNRKNSKPKNKIRSNSSSGIGITGELNNVLNARNNIRAQKNNINRINLQNNHNNSRQSLNSSQLSSQNKFQNQPRKNYIAKRIRKIHHFTHVGFNGEKDKDFNQDIAFVEKNFAGNNTFLYMAVCDGHGVEGHKVSGFIKRTLPKDLSNALMNKEILTSDKNLKKKIYNIIGSTFIKVNEKLISNESINSIFSGTTCVSVIYTPIKLICANIGDSRAVIGRFEKNTKKWIPINLSRDHKPTEEDEAKRILKKGGRIKPFVDEETGAEVGPPRVWVRDDEVPGLAMTRSFGDRVATIAGTICVPEIKEYAFHEGDKFCMIASDGIWEFISSAECINIIGKFYENNEIVECCEYLYNESRKRWLNEEDVVDDITMLLIFFD